VGVLVSKSLVNGSLESSINDRAFFLSWNVELPRSLDNKKGKLIYIPVAIPRVFLDCKYTIFDGRSLDNKKGMLIYPCSNPSRLSRLQVYDLQ
jgi:hypothetical protein